MIRALAGQSAVYAAATIVSRGAQVLALLILPLILAPQDYGAMQLILAAGVLANFIIPLEISQGLARYFPGASPDDKPVYASSAWWFTVAMLSLATILALPIAGPLAERFLGSNEYLDTLRLGVLLIALTSVFYFLQGQSRWQFDTKGYALISILFAFGTLGGAVALGLTFERPIEGVMLGQVIGAAVAVAVGIVRLRDNFVRAIDPGKLQQMLRLSLPLVPAQLALFATVYGSRLILNDLASLGDVGRFTYASQIAGISALAVIGVSAALTPLIMAHHEEPGTPATLARIFEIFTAAAICLCLGLGFFADEFIRLAGDPAYAEAAPLVMILAPAVVMAQMYIFAPGFLIAKQTIYQLWVSLVSGAACIALNYLLIAWWGISGAAWATLASAFAFLGLWFVLSQPLYPIPVRWGRVALAVGGSSAIAFAGMSLAVGSAPLEFVLELNLIALAALLCWMTGLAPRDSIIRALAALRRRDSEVPEEPDPA